MQENSLHISSSEIDQAQFEADKRAVYKHPLFSLLALLLEKCEQATQGYISNLSMLNCGEINNTSEEEDTFSKDVQTFVHLLEKEKRPLLTNNTELDSLMIKALQVLRIHLLELEKVQELCKDFCTRYIACLRGKMQSENLLRTDYALDSNILSHSNSNSPTNSSEQEHISSHPNDFYSSDEFITNSDGNSFIDLRGHFSPCGSSDDVDSEIDSFNDDLNSNISNDSGSKGRKRGILPKHATGVMKAWLFQHLVHPYPTEEEKRTMATETNLTLLQVNNWFINARRRIIQPMLENVGESCSNSQSV